MTVDTKPEYLLRSHPEGIDAGIAETVVELSKKQPKISPGFDLARRLSSYHQLTTGETVISSFKAGRYLQSELKAKANPYLPTIGVELEIPKDTVEASANPYYSINKLDFTSGTYEGAVFWEFPFPYSYAASTQALLIHTLLQMQFIPYQEIKDIARSTPWSGRRQIPNRAKFSLHCNLGIPTELDLSSDVTYKSFSNDATYLAMACGLFFTPVDRLADRKATRCVSTDRESLESDKNPPRSARGRVELTPLGFGNSASYRQLYLIQQLGVAFFAYEKSLVGTKLDQKEEVLATSWRIVQDHLRVIFERANLDSDVFGNPNSREQFRSIIQDSGLVKHLKVLIPALISHIRLVIKGEITEVF